MHTKSKVSSRLLAFILAFVMAFTLIIPNAFAQNSTSNEDAMSEYFTDDPDFSQKALEQYNSYYSDAENVIDTDFSSTPMIMTADSAYISIGSTIWYGGQGWGGQMMYTTSDGETQQAYCTEPMKYSPSQGTYTKHYDLENYIHGGGATADQVEYLRKIMWYMPGCPGYDEGVNAGIWPTTWPTSFFYPGTTEYQMEYIAGHLLVSWYYTYDLSDALAYMSTYFAQWFQNYVLGAYTVEGYSNTTGNKIIYEMPSPPDSFQIYALNVNSSTQTILGWEYVPEGPLSLEKTAEDATIVENNTCYSLEGAVYNVYTDSACTVQATDADGNPAVLTTNSDGITNTLNMIEGNYYVKETQASKGYALDETTHNATVSSSQSTVVYSQDPPVNDPTGLILTKVSNENVAKMPSLEGAQFTVHFYGGEYTLDEIDAGKPAQDGVDSRTWVLETKYNTASNTYLACLDNDYLVSGDPFYTMNGIVILPLGTITIQETKAPEGYTLNGYYISDSYGNNISDADGVVCLHVEDLNSIGTMTSSNGYNDDAFTKEDELIRGGLSLAKVDADTGENTPQGNATMAGAEFSIYDSDDDYVMSIVTDENGTASTSDDALIYGTYTVKETKAPEGYLLDEDWSATVDITEPHVIVPIEMPANDPVIRGGVAVNKRDIETGKDTPLGGASLQAVFTIYNESANAVVVDGVSYEPGKAVTTITTDAETGYGETAPDLLPYGHYRISETLKPIGYLDDGAEDREFDITEDGVIVDMTEGDNAIYNQVVRADFAIRKINDEDHSMAGVTFEIKSETTGETHYFTTDENGAYSSESTYAPHSYNTNGGEAYDGLWFGIDAPVDDSLGALPYDTYTITEMRSEANEGYTLWSDTITVTEKDNNLVIDLYNITDNEIRVETTAVEESTNSHYAATSENTVVIDEVSYENLPTSEQYVFVGYLYNTTLDEYVTNENNELVTAYTVFTPRTQDGHVESEFIFDSSDLGGCDIVVYEYLYTYDDIDGQLVTYEADPEEADQMIHFPAVETTALDAETGNHMSYADEEITIIDTVEYTNLRPGRTYTVTGVLMNQETGEPVLTVDGEQITSEATFTAEDSDGTVDVEFVFDGTGLEGVVTVVFETVYYNNSVYATHTDITDEGQTVYIPKIHTLAWADETGTNVASPTEDTVLYDTVWYKGLLPDEDYHIFGVLLDAETRQAEIDSEGNEIYSDYGPFTAETSEGQVDVEYHIDASQLAGRRTVFFEILYHVDYDEETGEPIYTLIAEEDIADAEQETIYFPEIGTTAWDIDTENHVSHANDSMTIIDTVKYTNLAPNKEYTVTGTLMDKITGEPMKDDNGNVITSDVTFTPEESDSTVDVEFTFSGVTLANSAVVAFEELYYDNTRLTVHTDITDEGQTVYVPEIHTTAINKDTGTHEGISDGTITIIDTIEYTNLLPGVEYTMTGELYNADTGNSIGVTAETVFTPETTNGTVDVEFTFDASNLGDVTIVVFEYCNYNGNVVAEHTDLDDTNQQVKLTPPVVDVPNNETPPEDEGGRIQTGEIIALSVLGTIALAAVIVIIATVVTRKRKA